MPACVVYAHEYVGVRICVHACRTRAWLEASWNLYCFLPYWDRVCQWTRSLPFPPDWLGRKFIGSVSASLPSAGVTGTHSHALLFYIGAREANSDPHACTASASTCRDISLAPLRLLPSVSPDYVFIHKSSQIVERNKEFALWKLLFWTQLCHLLMIWILSGLDTWRKAIQLPVLQSVGKTPRQALLQVLVVHMRTLTSHCTSLYWEYTSMGSPSVSLTLITGCQKVIFSILPLSLNCLQLEMPVLYYNENVVP